MKNPNKRIGIFALAMLITGSIDSIRNLPATALFGSSLIFFFVLSAIVFLIPTALISAELATTWKEHRGIYGWVKHAFGEKIAFLAIWLQWINTMVWYPTILSFIAGTVAYIINPQLAQSKIYLVSVILITFWSLTLINLRGLQASTKFTSFCAIAGMLVPMAVIIGLAFIWIVAGKPLQLHLSMHTLVPNLEHSASWISLTAIMTAFLGMELATVHVRDVHEPQQTFPKAMLLSVTMILATMIFGSLAIAFVLPHDQINLVAGVMQAFNSYFQAYHLTWLIPVMTAMLIIGSLGGMVNWIISPAKGLLQAAQHGYLPKFLQQENKYGVAQNLLLTQAILVTVICLAFLLMPSVNGSYWLLTDLSTELYMLMYVLMFLAALYLRFKYPKQERPFAIPGGKLGTSIACGLGLTGCVITFVVGFFPPAGIDVGSMRHFDTLFIGGIIAMLVPSLLFYGYRYLSVGAQPLKA